MKKLFTSIFSSLLIAGAFSANAAVELDTPFSLSAKEDEYNNDLEFVAPETGTLTAVFNPGIFSLTGVEESILFKGKGGSNPVPMTILNTTGWYITMVSWEVTAEEPYYFFVNLTNSPGEVTLSMGEIEITKPVCDVPMGEKFTVEVGVAQKYATEEDGVLSATITPGFNNWTSNAYMLYLSEDGNVDKGVYQYFTPSSSPGPVTKISWDVKAGIQYYLMGTQTTGNQTMTLSFTPDSSGGGDEENPSESWIPLEWNTASTVVNSETYSITGQGTPAHIETNKTDDLTIGSTLGLYKNGNYSDQVTLTPVIADNGYYYYNITDLEEGVKYMVEYQGFGSGVSVTFVEGLYSSTVVKEPEEIPTGALNLDKETVYYYIPGADGTAVITTDQCPYDDVPTDFIFTDADHSNPLEGVVATSDANGYYTCSFPVKEGVKYYIYFDTPNYIVGTLTWQSDIEEPEYMSSLPTIYFEDDVMYPSIYLIWNETLFPIDEETPLTGELTTPTGVNVDVTLHISNWNPDATDEPSTGDEPSNVVSNNALILPMGEYISQYGYGEYYISIGSIVMNEADEWNRPLENELVLVQPSPLSSVQATIAISGDAITISWDNENLVYYNPGEDDIQITPSDYSSEAIRLNTENGVSITENAVVISLEGIEFEGDVEYLIIVPENYVKIGEDGLGNEMIEEPLDKEATAIGSIGAAINGSEAIYNLQGVKVQNPVKGGIYIIGGRKVVIK